MQKSSSSACFSGFSCRSPCLLHVFLDFLAEGVVFCKFLEIFLQKSSPSACFQRFSCRRSRPLQVFRNSLAEGVAFCKFLESDELPLLGKSQAAETNKQPHQGRQT